MMLNKISRLKQEDEMDSDTEGNAQKIKEDVG